MSAGGASLDRAGEDVGPDPELQRVRVYRLNGDGNWADSGTGLITMQHLEQANTPGLVVCAETPPHKPLLVHKLSREDIYNKQDSGAEDTIISWQDPEAQTDIAISFQEAAGCRQLWSQIRAEQAHWNGSLGDNGLRRHLVDEMEPSSGLHEDGADGRAGQGPVELPAPEPKNLEQIAKVLAEVASMHQREQISSRMLQDDYVRKLLNVFRSCEDLEDEASLRLLFEIVKNTIMLNDTSLLELLFAEENVMDMVGALEHDPELPEPQRHRAFLRDSVLFREVVPIRNPALRAKIHQTYRMGYVKDVVLPRSLDDATFATFSSLIMFNNVEVVLALMDDPDFLPDLFRRFREAAPGSEARADCVGFLQELAALGKSLQPSARAALHQKLTQLGLFEALAAVMQGGSQALQLKASDVLLAAVQHDPSGLREFLLREEAPPQPAPGGVRGGGGKGHEDTLFFRLVQLLTGGAGGGLQEQATEVLRALLDPESMVQDTEKSDFLQRFYDHYIDDLMGVLEAGTAARPPAPAAGPSPAALGLIVDVLCFCVQHHGYRIKYWVLTHGVLEKTVRLLGRREAWLRVAAVRFVRTCLGVKDDFYHRHMIKVNLLEPILTAFVANGRRYNLFNSVVLEMFDFIRKANVKLLIRDFVERHYNSVAAVDFDNTFAKLRGKWEQAQEAAGGRESVVASEQLHAHRIRKDERALDRDEEAYFREDDDEEPARPSAAAGRVNGGLIQGLQMDGPLVDYADDDEEEAESPPGAKRHGQPPEPGSPQEKRGRFGGAPESARLFVASPPLLKPGADGMDWRRG